MRLTALGLVPLLLVVGCGGKYKPTDPVITGWERMLYYGELPSNAKYSPEPPLVSAPVPPVMAWGAGFDLDLVVKPKTDDFDMIEFARLNGPDGTMWVILETDPATGDQTIIADVEDINTFMPELGIGRQASSITVKDTSTESGIEVSFDYMNSRGQPVEASFSGEPASKLQKKRNGNTQFHSQNQLLAALDIPYSSSLFDADLRIADNGVGMEKVGGIVPFQFALEQGQGGLSVGVFRVVEGTPVAWRDDPKGPRSVENEMVAQPVQQTQPPDVEVKIGLSQNAGQIKECWAQRVSEAPELEGGRVEVEWTIEGGKVVAATVATPEGAEGDEAAAELEAELLSDEALNTCITEAVSGWSFSNRIWGNGTWPFVFALAGEGGEPQMSLEVGVAEFQDPDAAVRESASRGDASMSAEAGDVGEGGSSEVADESLGDEDMLAGDESLGDEDLLGDLDETTAVVEKAVRGPGQGPPLSSFTSVHRMADGKQVEMEWDVQHHGKTVTATQVSPIRTLTYEYLVWGDSLELKKIEVEQFGRAVPVTSIEFSPALPDVRRRFSGRYTSRYVIDVNGQQNHATGVVEVWTADAGPKVRVVPDAPKWTEDRIMLSTIALGPGSADVTIERVGE